MEKVRMTDFSAEDDSVEFNPNSGTVTITLSNCSSLEAFLFKIRRFYRDFLGLDQLRERMEERA